MKVHEELLVFDRSADRAAGRAAGPATPDEIEEAESLISDLTVLVDAGLIEVHEHVLGPVRYGLA